MIHSGCKKCVCVCVCVCVCCLLVWFAICYTVTLSTSSLDRYISIPWGDLGYCLDHAYHSSPKRGTTHHTASVHHVLHHMHNDYSTGHRWSSHNIFVGTAKLKVRPCNNNLTISLWNCQTQRQATWRSHWQSGCGKERMSGPIPCGV